MAGFDSMRRRRVELRYTNASAATGR